MGRPPCCDRSNVKRGLWTAEEDAKILAYVSNHGIGNWTLVPKKAGLNRCGKSCRLRWTNYLRPDLKHDNFTPEEEELIINLHQAIGSRWSLIAKRLPGRTDNDVKNYWNTKLRKKLQKMGIDPVTHKPFSQILSDFGNISGISNPGSQIGSLNKTLNTNLISKEEPSSVLTGPSGSSTTLQPVIEQVQDNTFNNPPLEFLSQFEVTDHEAMQPQFFPEVSSSCSCSSLTPFTQLNLPHESYSCQQSQAEITPSSPYTWSDFLLNDPVLPMECQQQEELNFHVMMLSTNSSALRKNDTLQCNVSTGYDQQDFKRVGAAIGNQASNLVDASSSSASSFVDGILDKDREMLSQFPQLLDPTFDY